MTTETDWREQACRTCSHLGRDHEANECWADVDGKQCGCTWMDVATLLPPAPSRATS